MIDTFMAMWNRRGGRRGTVVLVSCLLICISISLLLVTLGDPVWNYIQHLHHVKRVVDAAQITATPPLQDTPTVFVAATPTVLVQNCISTPTHTVGKTPTRHTVTQQGGTGQAGRATPTRPAKSPIPTTKKPAPIPTVKPTAVPTTKPTPKPTPHPTVLPVSPTPTDTPTPTPTPLPTPSPTPTPLPAPTLTPTPIMTPTPTNTPMPTVTVSPTPTNTPTPTSTATPTATVAPTDTPTATPSAVSTVPTTTPDAQGRPGSGHPVIPSTATVVIQTHVTRVPQAKQATETTEVTQQSGAGVVVRCLGNTVDVSAYGDARSIVGRSIGFILGGTVLGTLLFYGIIYASKKRGKR